MRRSPFSDLLSSQHLGAVQRRPLPDVCEKADELQHGQRQSDLNLWTSLSSHAPELQTHSTSDLQLQKTPGAKQWHQNGTAQIKVFILGPVDPA